MKSSEHLEHAAEPTRGSRRLARYTRHSTIRLQQRGIRPQVLEYLLDYGHEEHDHRGGIVVTFDGRTLASSEKGERERDRKSAHDCRTLYAVIDLDGCVITTGHRTQRVKRDRSLRTLRSSGLRRSPSEVTEPLT